MTNMPVWDERYRRLFVSGASLDGRIAATPAPTRHTAHTHTHTRTHARTQACTYGSHGCVCGDSQGYSAVCRFVLSFSYFRFRGSTMWSDVCGSSSPTATVAILPTYLLSKTDMSITMPLHHLARKACHEKNATKKGRKKQLGQKRKIWRCGCGRYRRTTEL